MLEPQTFEGGSGFQDEKNWQGEEGMRKNGVLRGGGRLVRVKRVRRNQRGKK